MPALKSLADLRRAYYGGGSTEEYAYLAEAQAAGITATDLLTGLEIDYAETTVAHTQATGGNSDIAGLVIDVPAQTRPWYIIWNSALWNGTALGVSLLRVMEGATVISMLRFTSATAVAIFEGSKTKRMAPFSGATRQFKVNLQCTNGGTANAYSDATHPSSIAAIRG